MSDPGWGHLNCSQCYAPKMLVKLKMVHFFDPELRRMTTNDLCPTCIYKLSRQFPGQVKVVGNPAAKPNPDVKQLVCCECEWRDNVLVTARKSIIECPECEGELFDAGTGKPWPDVGVKKNPILHFGHQSEIESDVEEEMEDTKLRYQLKQISADEAWKQIRLICPRRWTYKRIEDYLKN